MDSFAKKMKRKLNVFSRPKDDQPKRRPAKLRKKRREIEEEMAETDLPSASWVSSIVSPQTIDGDYEERMPQLPQLYDPSGLVSPVSPNREGVREEAGSFNVDEIAKEDKEVVDPPLGPEVADVTETEENEALHAEQLQASLPAESDPEQAQQIREGFYYIFTYEDPNDYTAGPCRMVEATDGIQSSAALLVTPSLSTNFKQAAKLQRAFAKAERAAVSKKRACLNLRSNLNVEIAGLKNRIMNEKIDDENELSRLEERLSNLELMLKGSQTEEETIQRQLEYQGRQLREIQARANAEMEEAFICANLLELPENRPDTPINERPDLQQEYQKFVNQMNGIYDDGPAPGSPVPPENSELEVGREPLTAEQAQEQDLLEAIWAAERQYQFAQTAFENRDAERERERRANYDAVARGQEPTDLTEDDFDLRWVEKIRDLTRNFDEAEKALSVARAAAMEAGVEVPIDGYPSGIRDEAGSGYHPSIERAMVESAPKPKIEDWRAGIPEAASPSFNEHELAAEEEEWKVDEDDNVGWNDSVSMVALEYADRKRIDRWNEIRKHGGL